MNRANGKTKFNPRLLPPLIGLALLVAIALAILFSRGGQLPQSNVAGQVVHQVEQTPKFTFLEVTDEGGERVWLAAPRVDVDVGDKVHYEAAQETHDFAAPSLKRKFERILLVTKLFKVNADGEPVALEPVRATHGRDEMDDMHGHGGLAGHDSSQAAGTATDIAVPKLDKPEGGQTLAEVIADASKFAGQNVKLRGTIVKARQRVRPALGQPATNWYRLQDGSGAAEPLLFTADEQLQPGDIVVITGKLALDKDFGGGLRYKMIVEGARVTREKAAD